MTSWQEVKLGDVCEKVYSGGTPKSSNMAYYGGSIPWLNTKEVHFNRIYKTEKYITESGLNNSSAKWVPANSVIVAMYGVTAGNVAINLIPLTTNQACCNLLINKGIGNYKFIFYYLLYKNIELSSLANGGAQQNLNAQQIKDFPITLPPMDIQKKIAGVLGALDDKIELNNKINNNLEQQAQALFKSWFVDFEPFGGVMPEDWKVGKVDEIIELFDSQRIPLSGNQRENMQKLYPYYGATSLMDYVDNYIFDGKYLLLGEDGTVIDNEGFPILQYVWGKFWVNNHAHILQGKNGFNVESLYLFFKKTNIKSIVTGAVQPKVNQANLRAIPAIIPNLECMNKFNKIIDPLFAMLRNNKEENTRLAAIRDALLPKLMSGEIDVSNVNISALTSTDKLSFTK